MEEKKPEVMDMAQTLRKHFTEQQAPAGPGPSRYRMSARNKRKLELIRQKVQQLRGGI